MTGRRVVRHPHPAPRSARRESGQLLLLAGMILVIGFITTAIALNEIGSLQKQVTEDQQTPLLTEYRFFRNRIGTSLTDATTPSTTPAGFAALFDSMHDTFRRMAQEKGYDFEVILAAKDLDLEKTEWSYTSWGWPHRAADANATWYNGGDPYPTGSFVEVSNPTDGTPDDPETSNPYWIHSDDDLVHLLPPSDTEYWDGKDDGIVEVDDCIVSPGDDCIQAAIVYIYMADPRASIEEYVVYSLNAQ